MKARFTIDGSRCGWIGIDLETDGARSEAVGEHRHRPLARADLSGEVARAASRGCVRSSSRTSAGSCRGDGDFEGTFHLFKGGHDLAGRFHERAGRRQRLPLSRRCSARCTGRARLRGHRRRRAGSSAAMRGFDFSIEPARRAEQPSRAVRRDATPTSISRSCRDFYELPGLRFAGRATGRNLLEWPTGPLRERTRRRRAHRRAAAGRRADGRRRSTRRALADRRPSRGTSGAVRPAAARRRTCRSPVTSAIASTPDRVEIDRRPLRDRAHARRRSRARPPGASESQFRFHVTSADWQESDQVLAGLLTDFGARTGPVAFGGPRRVRRRHDRPVPAAARRRALHRRGHARLGHALGRRPTPTS